jgi:hypothetical protein
MRFFISTNREAGFFKKILAMSNPSILSVNPGQVSTDIGMGGCAPGEALLIDAG